MKTFTIVRKMQLLMGVALLALMIVVGAGYFGISSVSSALNLTEKNTMPSLVTIGDIQTKFGKYRLAILQHVSTGDENVMGKFTAETTAIQKHLDTQFETYGRGLVSDDQDAAFLAADKVLFAEFQKVAAEVLQMSTAFNKSDAEVIMSSKGAEIGERLSNALEEHRDYKVKLARALEESSNASVQRTHLLSGVISLVGIGCVLLIGVFIVRGITGALSNMSTTLSRLEGLDFTGRADASNNDELGQMAGMLNRLLDKLQENLKSIALQASTVASASSNMASNSAEVAATSERQHSAASDIAATVEEMTVSINHVADRAREANRISSDSGALARSGATVIGQTATDIQDIAATVNDASVLIHGLDERSQQISSIVGVIKDVADQTNLLALNAAIEAARAGEQGRGFAVVADEVRKLAERTASSTEQISATVNAMRTNAGNAAASMQGVVLKVEQGVIRAREANEAIRQIGEGSQHAVSMVEEITTAIREQGSATNSIAGQVERMAQMAEESSAAVGHSAEAARTLDQLAADMQRIVGRYTL